MITYPVDIAILAGYFALIFGLLGCILPFVAKSWVWSKTSQFTFGFSLVALLTTWTYMFKYFHYSYLQWQSSTDARPESLLDSLSLWLHSVSLFDDAWRTVSVGTIQWLWSHQLCAFTSTVWMPFLAIEAQRRKIPYAWAYMLLGQVVAISFAACLFFAVMACLPIRPAGTVAFNASITAICAVVGIVTVVVSPFVATGSGFMPNLMLMHAVLVVPLLLPNNWLHPFTVRQSRALAAIYLFSAGANFVNLLQQLIPAIVTAKAQFIPEMISVFMGHPAQSSIGCDILCVNYFCAAWMILDSQSLDRPKQGLHTKMNRKIAYFLCAATPVLSISITLPLYLAWRELSYT
ncbi:hypothetical protein INT43_003737 [Umbelopsis isabellina]|uniref:Uncharacterized protein n=1 Tax=Mortierella isabellina TaxID=91625 RepID=A0A8H7PU58_MORIS|nr:hypothetical protein INT43_003737 [Umbelopsis isabellina]